MLYRFINCTLCRWVCALILISAWSLECFGRSYTLQQAVDIAQQQDPWIAGSKLKQESLEAKSIAANSLPDPSLTLDMANLPTDSFDFSQEGMTQLRVGVQQMFPRGKSRMLEQKKLQHLSEMQPFARANRDAQVAVTVKQLWLEIYRYEKTITLIEQDRTLFEHLVDVAQSNYTSASGGTRQQDLVRAQLELTQLDDRLTQLRQRQEVALAQMSEWLGDHNIAIDKNNWQIKEPQLPIELEDLSQLLLQHPSVLGLNEKLEAFDSDVQLAKQNYKPQWGLHASYAMRDSAPDGEDRADFISVGVSFDLPVFTRNRQDKRTQAAKADLEEVKTEKVLLLRKLKSQWYTTEAKFLRLREREALFNQRLLKEMADQAEAALSAYTHDDGDFAEVVRARIAELNARIDSLNIVVDTQKTLAELEYFFAGVPTKTNALQNNK